MSSYISSNNNRFYVAIEAAYGNAAAATAQNRIPAVKLTAKQTLDKPARKDKTGTRTFPGDPSGLRPNTTFQLTTYMTAWDTPTQAPPHGPLFQACLGGTAALWGGGTVSAASATTLTFTAPHGLLPGQAVTLGDEIRFVAAVVDQYNVVVNAPFTSALGADTPAGATATYSPASEMPSVTLFDYWDPVTAVQRVMPGMAVNKALIKVNGDFQEFQFSGQSADVVDSLRASRRGRAA